MRYRLTSWAIALLCAIALHAFILSVVGSPKWLTDVSQFEVTLLKSNDTFGQPQNKQTVPSTDLPQDTVNKERTIDYAQKPPLLDLSKITLSPEATDSSLDNIFSPVLKERIIASKKAQAEYLKGQVKSIEYPITEDADGTRYVDIKGVCWRIPKEGSNEKWAIVFAGCNGQTETFHFEINISPSMLLGSDSPFSLNK